MKVCPNSDKNSLPYNVSLLHYLPAFSDNSNSTISKFPLQNILSPLTKIVPFKRQLIYHQLINLIVLFLFLFKLRL